MLKPRPKESDSNMVVYRTEKEAPRERTTLISLQHIQYFFENHPYLRNTWLLFQSYHY